MDYDNVVNLGNLIMVICIVCILVYTLVSIIKFLIDFLKISENHTGSDIINKLHKASGIIFFIGVRVLTLVIILLIIVRLFNPH